MNRYLRWATYISIIIIIITLGLFTNSKPNMIISITLILLFLIIFTYIFKTDGSKTLKALIILFTFIGLPIFLVVYLKISILFCIISLIIGLLSIITIIKLDEVELIR